jgi:hypothetical protein
MNINNILKQDAILRACDETIISKETYRKLANLYPDLERYYKIEARRIEIQNTINNLVPIKTFFINDTNNNNNDDDQTTNGNETETSFIGENTNIENVDLYNGDGAYRSITSILEYFNTIIKIFTDF